MQEKQNKTALVWFRNDLRVEDNITLLTAIRKHKWVVACYCFEPVKFKSSEFGFKKTEKYRAKFLIETIKELRISLKKINIELFVFFEKPQTAIQQLVFSQNCNAVYYQKEWTTEETLVTNKVKKALPKSISFHSFYDQFLYHPEDMEISFSNIPSIFTNFRKYVEKNITVRCIEDIIPAERIKFLINTTPIPTLQDLGFKFFETHINSAFPFKGGEINASKRLNYYFFETKKIGFYKKTRNGLVGKDFSSKFSPWLANGSISARTIFWKVKQFEKDYFKNESTYWLIFELIWRDYFKYIALKHHNDIFKISGILNKDLKWNDDKNLVFKWINGETNSSFVNANMLELKKTGWMSNRGRQNAASYFAKELLLDWRIGASYFESLLLDYDVHSNYGNWMYVSGVGNDPRDRKFNVNLQAERYDANKKFQKMWLQETLF